MLFGGIKRIGAVAEKLVPVMAVIYIVAALIVVFSNLRAVGPVFAMIFKGAFSADAALGGATGIVILQTYIRTARPQAQFQDAALTLRPYR